MDQHLAVETHLPALAAFGLKTVGIRKIVEDGVDNIEPVGARSDDHLKQQRREIGAAGNIGNAGFLAQVVETDDETI